MFGSRPRTESVTKAARRQNPPASTKRSMAIRVELFTGAAGLRALAPAWRTLTAQLKFKRHFHHVEWYLALAETFERHNQRPLLCIAVFSDNVLVAVFPYRQDRLQIGSVALRLLKLVSDPGEAETARDLVIAPGLETSHFFQGFVKHLATHDHTWDVISLHGILEDSIAATVLKNSPQLPYFQTPGGVLDRGRIDFISCADDHRPFERLSRRFKNNLRTAHNKLKTKKVTFEVARSESDLQRLLPDFLKVESSGWKGELGTSALKDPETSTILDRLIYQFGPTGRCEIHVMRLEDEPIATLFGIVTDKIWYMFRIGYDEKYERASPGHLIVRNLLQQQATHQSFDIIAPYNAPAWLQAWKPDKTLQIFNSYVFRPSPEGAQLANQIETIARDLNLPILVPVKYQ